jgi:hypothetical protein
MIACPARGPSSNRVTHAGSVRFASWTGQTGQSSDNETACPGWFLAQPVGFGLARLAPLGQRPEQGLAGPTTDAARMGQRHDGMIAHEHQPNRTGKARSTSQALRRPGRRIRWLKTS